MKFINLAITGVLGCSASLVLGQTEHWTTVQFGNLQCDFPTAYTPINYTGASGIYYDGGNIYLTVTALPDTSSMKGNLDRDYTREFMNVVLDVSRKLQGKVREYRDTVIANMPGYISKMEVSAPDGRKSYYELLQLVHQDSLRGFSAQYFLDDPHGIEISQRFFRSISPVKHKRSNSVPGKLGLWIGGFLLVLIGTWTVIRKAPRKKHKKRT